MLLSFGGYNFEDHVYGVSNILQFIQADDGANVLNPTYVKFIQQDSSLVSWLLASVSTQVSRGLIGCMTTSSSRNSIVIAHHHQPPKHSFV